MQESATFKYFILLSLMVFAASCSNHQAVPLPKYGHFEVVGNDTVFHQVRAFKFLNQDSLYISDQTLSEYIYVADFFYSYCPTICPKVKSQMIRIHDKFDQVEELKLVSFALDPKRDNVEHLHSYAHNLGVDHQKWYFLTGDKDKIWDLAEDYLISVRDDPDEPGGIYHSGKILLIDKNGHIRAFANGTLEDEVTELISRIEDLLKEDS